MDENNKTPDYSSAMDVYKSLSGAFKQKADAFMKNAMNDYTEDNPIPPKVLEEAMNRIYAEQSANKGTLEERVKNSGNNVQNANEEWYQNPYLWRAAAVFALLYLGMPYIL